MARRRRACGDSTVFIAFGAGLLACAVLPTKLMVVLLATALVLCGCFAGNR
ncbi:MAG: hypothetical protein IJO76_06170 [Clostridia bacterium]|nr:hypothetical protein [Clostridia bacterium]